MSGKTKQASGRRQPTKDKVLQARISEQLDEELRDRAEKLGLSVSTIVRNVLLNTFDLVEGVVVDSSQLARTLTGRNAVASALAAEAEVIGWQELILNKNGVCESCNVILPVGERAAIGVPTGPRATLMCSDCLATLLSHPDANLPAKKATKRRRPASAATATGKPTD